MILGVLCEQLCFSNSYYSDTTGFGCLILFIHSTVSSVVRSYLQSQLKKCLQFNSILVLVMPQIELFLF